MILSGCTLNHIRNRPQFSKLDKDIDTDVCVIGSGISGISVAEQYVRRGLNVVMLEAREILSGESGRTSGQLASDLDDGYTAVKKSFGFDAAKMATQSHDWAIKHAGEVAKELGIDCEYGMLKGYEVSQYPVGTNEHDEDMKKFKEEAQLANELGLESKYDDYLTIKGWTGSQTTEVEQPNFQCYTPTRVSDISESGIHVPIVRVHLGPKSVTVSTLIGHSVKCNHAVQSTCVPLQTLSVIAQMEYHRTYCIAIRIPKGTVEDFLIYDSADSYKYVAHDCLRRER
ncbi:hypothetical protein MMC13_007871 [Lambiella insularis]|nr:hypothetical protein [Lambiella insularis]